MGQGCWEMVWWENWFGGTVTGEGLRGSGMANGMR